MKSIKTTIAFLLAVSMAFAQNSIPKVKKLEAGDTLPDVKAKIEHYDKPVFSLHELRGQYVILDLWNVYCTSCIAAMPRLEKLRQKHADKLEIIKVTRDSGDKLEQLYKRSEIARESKLPSIIGDTVISYLVDVRYVPSYLFIDKNGVLKYITSSFSDQDLEDFINDKPLQIKNHEDVVMMTYENPFIIEWYPYLKGNFEGQSYLAKIDKRYRTAGGSGIRTDLQTRRMHTMYFSSAYVEQLYKAAYGWSAKDVSWSRILFEADHSNELLKDSTGARQSYVYELRLKNAVPEQIFYKYVQAQLDLYFNVSSSLERRTMPCYVLKRNADVDIRSKESAIQSDEYKEEKRYVRKYVNWQYITRFMTNYLPFELIDETGIDGKLKVDIEFYLTPDDLPKMNKKLAEYGLFIEESKREMEVIVVRNVT